MEILILANGKTQKPTGREFTYAQMVIVMKANGLTALNMAKGLISSRQAIHLLGSIKMENLTVKEPTFGQMDRFTMGSFSQV